MPPKLAEIFARNLLADLPEAEVSESKGALLSFVPTLSTGMSPILGEVTRMVRRKFGSERAPKQLALKWD